jgi:hypothetical protein
MEAKQRYVRASKGSVLKLSLDREHYDACAVLLGVFAPASLVSVF